MRRALAAVLLLACGEGPDDLFVVGGRTLSASGLGLDGVPVNATRNIGGNCDEHGTPMRGVESEDGGQFSFDFIRVEVQSLVDAEPICVRLTAGFPSGAQAWSNLQYFPNRLTLGDLRDWQAGLAVDDAGVASVMPVVPQGQTTSCRGTFPSTEVVVHGLVARFDGGIAWEQTDTVLRRELITSNDGITRFALRYAQVPLQLQPEALEDFTFDVAAEAKRIGCVEVSGGGSLGAPGPYQVVTRWRSPGRVTVRGVLTPVSRGARCDGLGAPCALTDGVPHAVTLPRPTNRFTLRLAREAKIRAVVFRDALVDTSLLSAEELSVRNGSDARIARLDAGTPDPLDEIVFLENGDPARRVFWVFVLDEPVGPGAVVELELARSFYRLGELSLFE